MSALPVVEGMLLALCLSFLAANVRTLEDAIRIRRIILRSGENHGSQIWSLVNVRCKWCLLFAQVLSCGWGIDRVILLIHEPLPHCLRFIVYGCVRTAMSGFIAWTAWNNMQSFRTLRESNA